MSVFLVFFVLFQIVWAENHQFCGNFKPQEFVDVDMLLGKWFTTEIIFHAKEENEKIKYSNLCPTFFLMDVSTNLLNPVQEYRSRSEHPNYTLNPDVYTDEIMKPLLRFWQDINKNEQRQRSRKRPSISTEEEFNNFKEQTLRKLHLVWNDRGTRIEYFLRYNSSKPGYWMSFGSQNASLQDQSGFPEFIGTIQVLKAVRTHTILTFCHISISHQFFSVVISREPWIDTKELDNIHNLLERKQLPVRHVQRMCIDYKNLASSINFTHNQFIFVMVFNFIVVVYKCFVTRS